MALKRGDHVCALYSTDGELAQTVAHFLAEGLRHGQRCWYVASGQEVEAVRAALQDAGVNVEAESARGALAILSGSHAYIVHGAFNPETTLQVFNNAIERAQREGFTGFRAAAEMSWALTCEDGAQQLIVYEGLLRSLFETAHATGLCLYHRHRMPLDVIDGALGTHPLVGWQDRYTANPFYDPNVRGLAPVTHPNVVAKLDRITGSNH